MHITHMTIDKDKYRNLINARINSLVKIYDKGPEDIDSDGDEVDLVQGIVIKAISDKISERDKDYLKRLELALNRLDNGTYGECEDCGEQISEKRLSAVLDCKFCIECAEQKEKISKQYAKVSKL